MANDTFTRDPRQEDFIKSYLATRTLSPPPASANADLVQAVQALKDAIELAEEGWVYADAYFRDKWDLDGRLAILREVLSLIEGKTGDRDG